MDPETDEKIEPMSYIELAEKYLVLETERDALLAVVRAAGPAARRLRVFYGGSSTADALEKSLVALPEHLK